MNDRQTRVLSARGSNQGTAYAMSNKILTAGGRIFVAWLDHVADIVITNCDSATCVWGETVLLGVGTDNHCGPAITMDSSGYLYAIFGPHNAPFQFRRSVRPYDISEWTPAERFGHRATYPSLVCGPDDTLHLCYRGGEEPLGLMYCQRPPDGHWSEARELVDADVADGYTQFGNALVVGADGTLHLGFHIYDFHPKGGKAVGYLRSRDQGVSWETAAGEMLSLPVTPTSPCFVEQGRHMDMRASNVAVDSEGRPFLIAHHRETEPFSSRLWRHDGGMWESVELLPFLQRAFPGGQPAWHGTLTFDGENRLYIATVVEEKPGGWGHPSQEVVLLISEDLGRSFEVEVISTPDPTLAAWLPSIERPFGPEPIGVPAVLYSRSIPREPGSAITYPGQIVFSAPG